MEQHKSNLQHELRQRVPFVSLTQEAAVSLMYTADMVRRRLGDRTEGYGVTLQQYNVLRILRGAGEPLPTLEIADRMIEKTPGVTRLLDRLQEKGLVTRERCPSDQRIVHCGITQVGADLLASMDADVLRSVDESSAALSPDDLTRLLRLLEAIRRGSA